jgi:FkbM family methyltransferase
VLPRAARTVDEARSVVGFIWHHPANRGQRLPRLARAARFQIEARLFGRRALAKLGSRSRIWVELHRTAGSKALYANPPDYPEMLVWANVLKPGDLFVDIGANIGTYTIWAGDLGASVIAVEPGSDAFALLAENVSLNGYSVELIQSAAAGRSGTARFTSGPDCAVNRIDPAGTVEVRLVTVDDLLGGRVARGVKIDVEGFEIDVLRGCVESLAAGRIHLLQIEWNRSSETGVGTDRAPIADLLASFGYRLYRPASDGRLVAAGRFPSYGPDVFATRESSLADVSDPGRP